MNLGLMMKPFRSAAVFVLALAASAGAQGEAAKPATPEAPSAVPAVEKVVNVRMKTSFGDIVLELNGEKAPITVANFLKYVEKGFYEGTVFHRIMPNFMIQGGGYDKDLNEKAGTDAPIKNEGSNGLSNDRGTISMARTAYPDSATAQFFINVVDNTFLNFGGQQQNAAGYAVFGKVIGGMAVVDAIKDVPTRNEPKIGGQPAPPQPIVIEKVERIGADKVADAVKAANESAAVGKAELKKRLDEVKALKEAKQKEWDDYVKGLGTPDEQFTKAVDWLSKEHKLDTTKGAKSASGLWVLDEVVGTGVQPAATDTVVVNYTGWLVNGKKFDSSRDPGRSAYTTPLTEVVRGWTEGIGGMKAGGKRWLIIPHPLGYGERGRPPVIPPKATMVFEIELMEVVGK